jgi:hypothetical protein
LSLLGVPLLHREHFDFLQSHRRHHSGKICAWYQSEETTWTKLTATAFLTFDRAGAFFATVDFVVAALFFGGGWSEGGSSKSEPAASISINIESTLAASESFAVAFSLP